MWLSVSVCSVYGSIYQDLELIGLILKLTQQYY